ncbi:MAG: SpoIIE family protein phosphatase [Verrucomicrobia bacterium]|nr:SpoIIE family protein phosphatase [Verrucomicrobiota bacterium]
MAETSFSGKKEPEHPNKSQGKRPPPAFFGKLGFRVFFVALIFLVVPMLIHSWVKYLEDNAYHKKLLFVGLSEIVTGKAGFTKQIVQDKTYIMDLLAALITKDVAEGKFNQNLEAFDSLFGIVNRDRITGALFYQSLDANGEFNCDVSSEKLLVGEKNIFSSQQQQAIKNGESVFLDIDPITSIVEIFISRPVYVLNSNVAIGTITLSLDALALLNWIAMVEAGPLFFQISFLGKEGRPYVGQIGQIDPSEIYVFKVDPYYDSEVLFSQVKQTPMGKEYLRVFGQTKEMLGVQVAVPGTDFNIMAVSTLETVKIQPSSAMITTLLNIILIYLVIGGGLALLITIRISRPLNALCGVMENVERGNLSARYHHDRVGFEINVLGHTFNRMIDSVLHHVEEARNERMARELLSKELKIGHDIQRSILPRERPDIPGVEIATGFQGAREVAGDFYDIFSAGDKKLLISVADAAGKGISACLYSLCARSMFRSFAASANNLEKTILETNNLFCLDTAESGNFVTAWVGILEPETRTLQYASCGHLPAILRKPDGTITEIATPGIALGVMPIQEAAVAQVQLEKGDMLVLYTDGIIDSQDSYFEFYGKKRLIEVIKKEGGKTAEDLVDAILGSVEMFSLNIPLVDDRTLLVIRMV